MKYVSVLVGVSVVLSSPSTSSAQTRGFLTRLGADTVAVERITQSGNVVNGSVVRHTPTTSVIRYTILFRPDSSIAEYREDTFTPDGRPAPPSAQGIGAAGLRMTFSGDSVVREMTKDGASIVRRDSVHGTVLPSIGGTSPYWQELVLQAIRRSRDTIVSLVAFTPGQPMPQLPVRLIGADSAEILLGQGFRRGYRLDQEGRLLHGDGSNSTVRLQLTPTGDPDIDAIARAWSAADVAGRGIGVLSTRDTVVVSIGSATATIDYGRPAKRGRAIWGHLVPFDTVWRLGANLPTTITTDKSLLIGETQLAPGRYSMWLVPSLRDSYLLINRQTTDWVGVPMHDAAQDVARIRVQRHSGTPNGEDRFRILVQNGTLMMLWDDGGYDVPIRWFTP